MPRYLCVEGFWVQEGTAKEAFTVVADFIVAADGSMSGTRARLAPSTDHRRYVALTWLSHCCHICSAVSPSQCFRCSNKRRVYTGGSESLQVFGLLRMAGRHA